MRSQTRLLVSTTVFILIVLSFLHLKGNGLPSYLPQAAQGYFEPTKSVQQDPGSGEKAESSQKTTGNIQVKPEPTAISIDPKPIQRPPVTPGKIPIPSNHTSGDSEESNKFETERTKLNILLEEFVLRPLLSYTSAVEANNKTCPTDGINFDANSVRDNADRWKDIPTSQISDWRHNIASYLRQKQEEENTAKKAGTFIAGKGRGIVMAAGDSDAVIRARTNIRLLRSYNCILPIEIFHFSTELSAYDEELLSSLSSSQDSQDVPDQEITIRIVQNVEKSNTWKQFQIKAASIQQSSFSEILYLDTDSYLLRDPTPLFISLQFNSTGLLLWPDYTKSHPSNPIWRLLGQECRNEYEGESGQIYISRPLHQDLLWLVEYFALHHEEYYGFMGGDRDSFRAAALLLGKSWAGPGRLNAAAGIEVQGDPKTGGHTMLQADPDGKWMFVHANLIKHARFEKPLWKTIHRVTEDRFKEGTTYGDVSPPNDRLGAGVRLHVSSTPRMVSTMSAFEGFTESVVTVEEWDMYDELRGFEEKWFAFGGQH